jgi:hypothetical protein
MEKGTMYPLFMFMAFKRIVLSNLKRPCCGYSTVALLHDDVLSPDVVLTVV